MTDAIRAIGKRSEARMRMGFVVAIGLLLYGTAASAHPRPIHMKTGRGASLRSFRHS